MLLSRLVHVPPITPLLRSATASVLSVRLLLHPPPRYRVKPSTTSSPPGTGRSSSLCRLRSAPASLPAPTSHRAAAPPRFRRSPHQRSAEQVATGKRLDQASRSWC